MAADAAEVAKNVAFLQKTSTKTGGTVYGDLAKVIGRILLERPENAVDLLENTLLVKKGIYTPSDPSAVPEPLQSAATVGIRNLYVTPEPTVDPDTGAVVEAAAPNEFTTDDFVEASELFSAVGVGLGPIEMYHIAMAVQRLGESPELNLQHVRFFGKFFGLSGGYYVYEGKPKEPLEYPEDTPPENVNPKLNEYYYFAQKSPGGPTTQLPIVTPLMMRRAKQMKRHLTGNLDSEVCAFPLFPGKEAAYLRALCGHIAAECTLAPAGYFAAGDGDVEMVEGYAAPPAEEMADPAGWVHRHPQITAEGRNELDKKPVTDDQDVDDGEPPPQLSPIVSEEWASLKNSNVAGSKHQVGGVASMVWPGAYSVGCNGRYACIYVGDGIRNLPYAPVAPPPVLLEYDVHEGGLVELDDLPPKPEDKVETKEDEGEDDDDE